MLHRQVTLGNQSRLWFVQAMNMCEVNYDSGDIFHLIYNFLGASDSSWGSMLSLF